MANGVRLDTGWVQAHFPDLTNIATLNSGGQKIVFAATHPVDGDVVLKLINPDHVAKTLADRWHDCPACGLSASRDHVSARVILSRARCGLSGANVEDVVSCVS